MKPQRRVNPNALIHKALSRIIFNKSSDPRFAKVTISSAEVSKDKSYAVINFSMFPADEVEDVEKALNKAASYFRVKLGKVIQFRKTPELRFKYDKGFDYAQQINSFIKAEKKDLKKFE